MLSLVKCLYFVNITAKLYAYNIIIWLHGQNTCWMWSGVKNAAAIIVLAFIHNIEINKQKEYNKNIKNS